VEREEGSEMEEKAIMEAMGKILGGTASSAPDVILAALKVYHEKETWPLRMRIRMLEDANEVSEGRVVEDCGHPEDVGAFTNRTSCEYCGKPI